MYRYNNNKGSRAAVFSNSICSVFTYIKLEKIKILHKSTLTTQFLFIHSYMPVAFVCFIINLFWFKFNVVFYYTLLLFDKAVTHGAVNSFICYKIY